MPFKRLERLEGGHGHRFLGACQAGLQRLQKVPYWHQPGFGFPFRYLLPTDLGIDHGPQVLPVAIPIPGRLVNNALALSS